MNPLTGIQQCIYLTYIVIIFSLLVREENLITCRFDDLFAPNKPKKFQEELNTCTETKNCELRAVEL
jgi:hypothetical protein